MSNVIAIALAAILSVESSGGRDLRVGDNGRAVGSFQIWRIAVDEANRVEKIMAKREKRSPRRWSYSERKSHEKSTEMCRTTLVWHYLRGTTNAVDLACKWNTPYKPPNPKYRAKIARAISEQQKSKKEGTRL